MKRLVETEIRLMRMMENCERKIKQGKLMLRESRYSIYHRPIKMEALRIIRENRLLQEDYEFERDRIRLEIKREEESMKMKMKMKRERERKMSIRRNKKESQSQRSIPSRSEIPPREVNTPSAPPLPECIEMHSDRIRQNHEKCAICFEYLDTQECVTSRCYHTFHKDCFDKILESFHKCPMCRCDL